MTSTLRPLIVHGSDAPPPSPEMVRATERVAEWLVARMGQHGGRTFHEIAPVEVRQVPWPIRGDRKAGAFPTALERHEVLLAFVIGAARGGNGWHYPPSRGAASVSAYSLEVAMRWPGARDDVQRHQIESDAVLIALHEMAHAAYDLRHASPDPWSSCRDDHLTCYMRRSTFRALPAGEGFDEDERRQIAQQTWLKAVPMLALVPPTPPPPPTPAPRVPWALALARAVVAAIRTQPAPMPVFRFGGPAFQRAPVLARKLIVRHFDVDDWEPAAAIGERESGWNTNAIRDTRHKTILPVGHQREWSAGWFQVNMLAHPEHGLADLLRPSYNVPAAAVIKRIEGWGAWLLSARALGLV